MGIEPESVEYEFVRCPTEVAEGKEDGYRLTRKLKYRISEFMVSIQKEQMDYKGSYTLEEKNRLCSLKDAVGIFRRMQNDEEKLIPADDLTSWKKFF